MAKRGGTRKATTTEALPMVSPTPDLPKGEQPLQPQAGVALCLSGGGYRAMLFHVGAIIRLNELGVLRTLKRISSVSGGSITAGVLGLRWNQLDFDAGGRAANLDRHVIQPIRRLAAKTIDRGSIITGVLLPGSVSDRIVGNYREMLFGDATLQDLPTDEQGPRFVINATSVQSGALVRMSRPYLADHRVGVVRDPMISLAEAVAASSAFPPFLSPAEIDVDPTDFDPKSGGDLHRQPFTDTMVLTDGGVYDNLGLETVWKNFMTILVSDAGGKIEADPDPAGDWAQHSKRIVDVIDNQVRSLRKRQLISSFIAKTRQGAYWGIRTDIANYPIGGKLTAPVGRTLELADTPTRLKRLPADRQEKLINWGYAVCDAAVRSHAKKIAPKPPKAAFPFKGGVG